MTLSIEDATRFAQVFKGLVDGVSVAVLDKRQAVRLALTTMFAGGHLLLEDAPGTGKTALARAISAVIDGTHSRIQFTPDLLPSDITGVNMFNQKTGEWVFHAYPCLRGNRPRRRDQPCVAQDAVRPPGGHGRSPGDG